MKPHVPFHPSTVFFCFFKCRHNIRYVSFPMILLFRFPGHAFSTPFGTGWATLRLVFSVDKIKIGLRHISAFCMEMTTTLIAFNFKLIFIYMLKEIFQMFSPGRPHCPYVVNISNPHFTFPMRPLQCNLYKVFCVEVGCYRAPSLPG